MMKLNKRKIMPKKMQIKTISMLLRKNYKMNVSKINLEMEVDSKLTLPENWRIIKERYVKVDVKKFI